MENIEMVCPDVGQANCSYVHKDGKAIIFDMGDGHSYETIKKSLEDNKITNVKIVISHLDDDHCKGLIKLLEEFSGKIKIDELILPERGDNTDVENFNKIRRLVYQNEVVSSAKKHFKMNEEEFKDFSSSIRKDTKNKNNPIYKEFTPKNEKERLALKFLIFKANNKTFSEKDLKDFKKIFNNNEEEMYKYIKDYSFEICKSKGYDFLDMHMKTLVSGKEIIIDAYDFGSARLVKPEVDNFDKENFNSIVSFLDIKMKDKQYCTTICFPGDIEAEQEKKIVKMMGEYNMRAAIMISPHYASNTSSTKEFVEAVRPSLIVIQARKGVYNHPHPGVLKNYDNWDISYIIQEYNGTVKFQIEEHDYIYVMTDVLQNKIHETSREGRNKMEELNKQMTEYLKELKDKEKSLNFLFAEDKEKIDFFKEIGMEDSFRKAYYAWEAAETILEKGGIDIQDSSFFKLAYINGKLKIEDKLTFFSKNDFSTVRDVKENRGR